MKKYLMALTMTLGGCTFLMAQCLVFEDKFNGSTTFSEAPYPLGACYSCGYPKYCNYANDGEKQSIVAGCGDNCDLRKTLNLPYGKYKIRLTWNGGTEYYQINSCAWGCHDDVYGVDCIYPKRLIVVDGKAVYHKSGALLNYSETAVVDYEGTMNKMFLSVGTYGYPNPYTTQFDNVRIEAATPISADFSVSGNCAQNVVQFTDKSGSIIKTWAWKFGDGATSDKQFPTHSYADTGSYQVQLTVTDYCNQTKTISKEVKIGPRPKASFLDSLACFGTKEDFMENAYSASGVQEYHWDFGNGNSSKKKYPGYIYYETGKYTVSLWVKDSAGCISDTFSKEIKVLAPPVPVFNVTKDKNKVNFINSTPDASSYLWEFGDGQTSNEFEPVHVYKSKGTFNACLTARNECDTLVNCQSIEITDLFYTGIGSKEVKMPAIDPNPVLEVIQLSLNGTQWESYSVLNSQGKEIMYSQLEPNVEKLILPTFEMKAGWYNLRLVNGAETHSIPFQKVK